MGAHIISSGPVVFCPQMDPQTQRTKPLESVRKLLTGAIDYAGLFPPSQLTMEQAVMNYALNVAGPYRWMIGRFVLPVARLDEFYEVAAQYLTPDLEKGCRLTVLAGENISQTIRQIINFNTTHGPNYIVDSLEVKASSVSKIENTVSLLPNGITTYFEITQDEKFVELVTALALRGLSAKLRTGGVVPEAFPKSLDVIRFVRTCAAANVPFKATAGLHHPVRCYRPLTYAPGSPKGTMHGFLNLFLMSGFARESYKVDRLEQLMEEEFDEVFHFDENGVQWRDDNYLNLTQIDSLRKHGIQSFGSCSIDEPVADLQNLGLL